MDTPCGTPDHASSHPGDSGRTRVGIEAWIKIAAVALTMCCDVELEKWPYARGHGEHALPE